MRDYTGHVDTFARDHLPPQAQWPALLFERPEYQFPERVNAAALLDRASEGPARERPAVLFAGGQWTYGELQAHANRIARVLIEDLHLQPGNRVLLHAPNAAMTIAAWWAILKAGGIAVTTMPMLRAAELSTIIEKAQITHGLAHAPLHEAVEGARAATGLAQHVAYFGEDGDLEARASAKSSDFENAPTARDDVALIAFTSGTTGKPKGCVHFHRDLLVLPAAFSGHIVKPSEDEIFCGTPPFAFTFGLGGSIVFPAAVGAATAICSRPGYDALCETIARERVTTLFTAPTAYRALLKLTGQYDLSSLRKCVSAGEPLDAATSEAWFAQTGLRIIDGIGATEMLHIFISAAGEDVKVGATGRPVPGYEARIIDEQNKSLPPGEIGRLAVRGPTGCRYLADERQTKYVIDGWNVTGDLYRMDEDGYFWFVSRADDMIISAGYNIAAPEVEQALLKHDYVAETAVVAAPDAERGHIVKAFIVLQDGVAPSEQTALALQDFVKNTIAPYKYPRAIEFVSALPKTETGKLQRYRLKQNTL